MKWQNDRRGSGRCSLTQKMAGNTSKNVKVGKASRPRNTMLEIIKLFDFVKRKGQRPEVYVILVI
jgi:hypothetical protein